MLDDAPMFAAALAQPAALTPALTVAAAAAGAAGAALALASLRLRGLQAAVRGLAGALTPRAADLPAPRAAGTAATASAARFRLSPGPRLWLDTRVAARLVDDLRAALREREAARGHVPAAVDVLDPHAPLGAESFATLFPADAARLEDALERLERFGDPFTLFLRGADGGSWSAHGAPEDGVAWVSVLPADPRLLALRIEADAAAEIRRERAEALALLDSAPVLAWRRDAEGRLTWANAPYRAFTATPENEAPRPLDGGGDGGAAETAHDGIAEDPGVGRKAFYHGVTGQRRWFEVSRILCDDGSTLGYAADAGAAVIAESALRRFVETLTETFAHLRIGLAIFDDARKLGLFNPAFAEMMRLDPSWLAGRPRLEDVLAKLRENRMMPDRADYAAWRAELTALFSRPDAADYAELWQLPGEVAIRVLARPHPQGGLAFLFEDVTETAQLERRFAAETENRRAVIDRLEEAVAAFHPHGGARFANPAFSRIWGFMPGTSGAPQGLQALIRRCRPQTAPPPPGPNGAPGADIWDRLAAFAEDGARRTAWSERVEMTDGRVLRARIATLPDGAILTAFTDITANERAAAALKERNDALEAATEMRGALFEQTTARLRGPLHTVAAHAERLRQAAQDGSDAAIRAEGILSAARQLQEALDGMCDLANAQEGSIALARDEVDLTAAFDFVSDRVRAAAEERGVSLTVEVAPQTGPLFVDGARLRQILVNLLTDAVQRAPRGRVVRAGARPGPQSDAGEGTVQFWAVEPPGSDGARRGLAHALARRLAELHGGSLHVRQGPGGPAGPTEVVCTLPAPAAEAGQPAAPAALHSPPAPSRGGAGARALVPGSLRPAAPGRQGAEDGAPARTAQTAHASQAQISQAQGATPPAAEGAAEASAPDGRAPDDGAAQAAAAAPAPPSPAAAPVAAPTPTGDAQDGPGGDGPRRSAARG